MAPVSRRVFGAGALAAGLTIGRPLFAEEPRRGGTLVATWGGGEPQACYVPAGGGSSPIFSSSKLFERLVCKFTARNGIAELRAMDDRLLADIGLTRQQVEYIARHGRRPTAEHSGL